MLQKKKGYNIGTKSLQCKLIRNGIDLTETKLAYNEVVTFYFALINTYPEHILSDDSEYSGWRAYELLSNPCSKFPLPYDIPAQLKRSAIRKAIGAWESWNTSYQKWRVRPNLKLHHRPPVQPRKFNFSPSYDAGVWREDFDGSILLKIKIKGQWKWIKFDYQRPEFVHDESGLNGWHKASPSIVIKGNKAYLTFSLQKYITATGGIKNQLAKNSVRVLGVDMDLDRNIAILSVLEIDAKGVVVEVARHFISQSNHTKRRKRFLGRIAIRMRKTGIINKGFCNRRWEQIHNTEREMGRRVAREIVNFARDWKCSVIAFEHLTNLKPCRGKYSRRSNQKRAYWLKSKVFQETNRIAYQDYGILTTRVNPRDTSRLDPWNNELYRINLHSGEVAIRMIHDGKLEPKYEPGADFVINPKNCYSAHSGLNAARNIGLKAILRHRTNAVFVLRKA
jgi:IS605 OrfB family transposase